MASIHIPPTRPRVSSTAQRLLSMVSGVDSYHTCVAVAGSFNDVQMQLCQDERTAMIAMMRGLRLLFPFDPERDQEHQLVPRHAL